MSFEAEISSKPDCLLPISVNYSFLSSSELFSCRMSLDRMKNRVVEYFSELKLVLFVLLYMHGFSENILNAEHVHVLFRKAQ